MEEITYHQNICSTIKIIRNYKGFKQDYVSVKSGFKDRSVYAKTESGQIKSIPITKFHAICKTLQCNAHVLLLLAAVDSFSYKISSWGELMDSIEKSDETQRKYMLGLVSQLFPNEKPAK